MTADNEKNERKQIPKIWPIFLSRIVKEILLLTGQMALEVTEESVVAAMSEICKTDTVSVQSATEYLLQVMNTPENIMIFMTIITKPYPDVVFSPTLFPNSRHAS